MERKTYSAHRAGAAIPLFAIALVFTPVTAALAQAYPTKAVRLIVPAEPGGGLDIPARSVAQGLSQRFGQTVFVENVVGAAQQLGVLALVGWVIAFIPAIVIAGGGAFFAMMRGGGDLVSVGALGFTFMLAMLVSFALALPLYMAPWFAPSLIVFNDLKPVAALKASFFGCMKNIVPFLIYGVVLLVLCLVAAIPLALGFLVLGPVAIASIYTGYKDVFAVE